MNRIPQQNSPQPTATVIPVAFAEESVVTFNCYEPNSLKIPMTEEDLVRHTLFVGTTGSGKTTTMNQMLRDLIGHRACSPAEKLGLLVMDSKCDDTVDKVRAWAAEASRSEDVVVLAPGSSHGYDPLLELKNLADVESVSAKIRSTARRMNSHDGFWLDAVERLLDAGLTALFVTSPSLAFAECMGLLNQLFLEGRRGNESVAKLMQDFDAMLTQLRPGLTQAECLKLEGALAELRDWVAPSGDNRVKESIAACLANSLKALRSLAAQDYFAVDGRVAFELERIVTEGKILVVSVNAAGNPELAQTLLKLIKADYFRVLQQRRTVSGGRERLAGLVLDEYPLAVTGGEGRYSDATQLQTLRSKRGFIVAATQGFISLDQVVGSGTRAALLANFNNLFFMKSQEAEVEAFVQTLFGQIPRTTKSRIKLESDNSEDSGATMTVRQNLEVEMLEWVCKPGALSNLEPGETFLALARGGKFKHPVTIEPLYFNSPAVPPATAAPPSPLRQRILEHLAALAAKPAPVPSDEEAELSAPSDEEAELYPINYYNSITSQPTSPVAEAKPKALPKVVPVAEASPAAQTPPPAEVPPVEMSRQEADELTGATGLIARLWAEDQEFKRLVRLQRAPDHADGTARAMYEEWQLIVPRSELLKLETLPPQTSADHELIRLAREILAGRSGRQDNRGEDVPF